ncbi:MlaD family protein [Nocardia sp. NBC_01388]|uniref:MlaD family protein n=1 Tax=Nocardia sp. NBC_01388 TaxID=2903596 RepID=UPI003253E399
MKLRSVCSLGAIVVLLVAGSTYLAVGVLQLDPLAKYTNVRMVLPNSGGLAVGTPVLLTGVAVGSVTGVSKVAGGVDVELRFADRYRVPVSSMVRVEALSALGEPYVEFAPADDRGPYLRNNQLLDTRVVPAPVSIPQMSARIVELVSQLDPKAIATLVDTVGKSVSGTESDIPRLEQSTKLLAAAILSRTDTLRQLLTDLQAVGGDSSWLGPALQTSGPEWGTLGTRLDQAISAASKVAVRRDPSDYLSGDGLVPFLSQLNGFLDRIGPSMQPLVPILQPMAAEAKGALSGIDISALIAQALSAVGEDGTVHLQLTVK